MLRADASFVAAVEETVAAIEERSDAEIVVVVAARSSSWRARRGAIAAALAFAVLAFAVYGPTEVPAFWLPVDVLLVYALAAWLPGRFPALLRALTTPGERAEVCLTAAESAFHHEEVHSTRRRTGILVYLSLSEREVIVLPDNGVSEHVPPGALEQGWRLEDAGGFLAGLSALGPVLAEHLPAVGDNPDELPNRPRVRA